MNVSVVEEKSKPIMKEHMGVRQSSYPMISISKAVSIILNEIQSPTQICHARLNECGNRILAKDIYATIDLPRCNTSIMDGYAMNFSVNSNNKDDDIYKVVNIITAGHESAAAIQLKCGEVVYVTTGSALPSGTDCVIPLEDTEIIDANNIKILTPPKSELQFVRTKGSDIKKGQLLLSKGIKLQSVELGILASCGIIMVDVYSKIRITILCSGDELKDPFTFDESEDDISEHMNLIFDSNKIMLMQLINESLPNLCVVTDGGIIGDNRDKLKQHIIKLLENTDILITSGGVSMGSRDFVKPILNEIGEIKFGRVCMKPGKPTTFAIAMIKDNKKLIFGLPGNPVSTHLCFKVFVEAAIKKYSGILNDDNCKHPPISVEIANDIKMDPLRPSYNRCAVYWDQVKNKYIGFDTGSQRASRLLSCKSANCLLRIPQKDGIMKKGTMVKGLIIGQLTPEIPPEFERKETDDIIHGVVDDKHKTERKLKMNINVGILRVSDTASKRGVDKDESECILINGLKNIFGDKYIDKMDSNIVSNKGNEIEKYLKEWDGKYHLIVTIGGTGFNKKDIIPEITKKFIERECPGIVCKMMQYGLKQTEFACLSRETAGITKNDTLIINMPGMVNAVKQCLHSIKVILPHAINQINNVQV